MCWGTRKRLLVLDCRPQNATSNFLHYLHLFIASSFPPRSLPLFSSHVPITFRIVHSCVGFSCARMFLIFISGMWQSVIGCFDIIFWYLLFLQKLIQLKKLVEDNSLEQDFVQQQQRIYLNINSSYIYKIILIS